MDTIRKIRSPRRNNPPTQVAVNKCGAVSLLSVLRHIGLPDRTVFDITFNASTGEINLIPEEGTTIETFDSPMVEAVEPNQPDEAFVPLDLDSIEVPTVF